MPLYLSFCVEGRPVSQLSSKIIPENVSNHVSRYTASLAPHVLKTSIRKVASTALQQIRGHLRQLVGILGMCTLTPITG